MTPAVRDLHPKAGISRRATLRYQIAGSLILALALAAVPTIERGLHAFGSAGQAFADDGGGEGGGSGGGDGGDSGGGDDGSSGSGSGSSGSGEGGEGGSGESEGGSGENEGEAEKSDLGGLGHGGEGRREVEHELVAIGPDANLAEQVAPLGIAVVAVEPFAALGLSVARLRLPDTMSLAAGRALLEAKLPGIELEANTLYAPLGSVTLPGPDYARQLIGWPAADPRCGAGLRLGLIDTGLDRANPALAGRDIAERSFLDAGATPALPEHGTTVAGILVGAGAAGAGGLLPAAKLYAAGVFAENLGGEPLATAVGFVGALDWLVGSGVRAINVSLAGDDNRLMALAVSRAAEKGAVLVAAAGNGGPTAPPAYPAALDEVLAVTAVDADGRLYPEANRGDYVDFAAPGVRVHSPTAPDTSFTGTSFATPFVTAIAAAELGRSDDGAAVDAAALGERLARESRDLGAPGRDAEFGWGLAQGPSGCGG